MKINIQAEYDSLAKLSSKLKEIKTSANALGLIKVDIENVNKLLLSAEKLKQLFDVVRGKGFDVDLTEYKKLSKLFDELTNKGEKFGESLIKALDIKGVAKEAIQETLAEIQSLRAQNKQAGQQKSILTRRFAASKNAITAEQGVKDAEGHVYAKFEDLEEAALSLANAERTLSDREKAVISAYERILPIIANLQDAWKSSWEDQDNIIQQNKQKAEELEDTLSNQLNAAAFDVPSQNLNAARDVTAVINDMNAASVKSTQVYDAMQKKSKESATSQHNYNKAMQHGSNTTKQFNSTLGKAVHNVVSYGSAITIVRQLCNKLIGTITEMDKALTGMTVVTQLSREQAWALTGTLQDLAKSTGMTSTEVANMTTMYLQQGETLSNALKLTEAAAKAARIAGISGSESINLLTNAMNGFQMSATRAMEVSDKFASLAAAAATDYEELATALSKVAAQANLAGMSMDFTLGLLTKGIEVTREAPETIGTALKTVISRMRELSDYGDTLEDGVDVNRVESALAVIGVQLLDENRQFRDLEVVLTEVGTKWDQLTTNQQANIAVALAGTRQQSRLIAMMQNFDRTQELVNISMQSAGATAAQHRKYMQGLEAATTKLTTSYQELITNFSNSDIVISVINTISTGIQLAADHIGLVQLAIGGIIAVLTPYIALKAKEKVVTLAAAAAELLLGNRIKRNTIEVLQSAAANEVDTLSLDDKTRSLLQNVAATKSSALGIRDEIRQKIASRIQTELESSGIEANTAAKLANDIATKTLTTSTETLNKTQSKNIWMLIIAAAIALISAWYNLNKETETGKKLAKQVKDLFAALAKTLSPIMDALSNILDLLMSITNILIDEEFMIPLQAASIVLQGIANILNTIIKLIQRATQFGIKFGASLSTTIADAAGLGEDSNFAKKSPILSALIRGERGEAAGLVLDRVQEWLQKDAKNSFWTSTEEYVQLSSDEISTRQVQIYDNRQLTNSLQPLLDEYKLLDSRAIKTQEDLERLKEIQTEIGDMDASYLNSNGTVNTKAVTDAINKANTSIQEDLQKNLQAAQEALALYNLDPKDFGEVTDEIRSGITDFYTEQAALLAKSGDVSIEVANKVSSGFKSTVDTMTSEQLGSLRNTQNGFEDLYSSILNFEKEQAALVEDNNNSLSAQIEVYQTNFDKIPDSAKEAFQSIYSIYATYSEMIKDLTNPDDFLIKVDKLGLTSEEMNKMRKEYEKLGLEQSFDEWFKEVVQNSTKDNIVTNMVSAAGTVGGAAFRSIAEQSVMPSFQDVTEGYATQVSRYRAMEEAVKKLHQSGWDPDEVRKLQQEYPELFDEYYDQVVNNTFNADDLINKAASEAREQLINRLQISTDTTEQNSIKSILGYLDNATLYATELWDKVKDITTEYAEQERIQGDIDDLMKDMQNTTDPSKRKSITASLLTAYQKLYGIHSKILEDPRYAQAVEAGYIKNGKIVVSADELKNSGFLGEWLADYATEIEAAGEMYDKYINDTKDIIKLEYETQQDILEQRQEAYEEYFDQVDAWEEEQERQQNKQSILAQLSALSGGISGTTKALQKDLLSQLSELEKEEAEAQKQAARDRFLSSISENVNSIKDAINELEMLNATDLESVLNELQLIPDTAGGGYSIKAYKHGGLVDFTGPAWVDGTKSKPEAFLDAYDTQVIQGLVKALTLNLGRTYMESTQSENSRDASEALTVIIEKVEVKTECLNGEQDFTNAGSALAREFAKVIQERGLNVNVKK